MSLHLGIPCGQRQCTQRGLDSAGGDGHRGNLQNEDLAIEFGNLKLISAGTSKCQWTSWVKKVASWNSTTSWTSFSFFWNAQNARNATGERSQARQAHVMVDAYDKLPLLHHQICGFLLAFIVWYDFPLYCCFPDGPQRAISQYNCCWRGLFNHHASFWWCTSTVIHHSSWSYQRECSYNSLLFQVLFFRGMNSEKPDQTRSHIVPVSWP